MRKEIREIVIENGVKLEKVTEFYDNGQLMHEMFFRGEHLHREEDKPAEIIYRRDGCIACERYYKNNKIHRGNNKPAEIKYSEDSVIEFKAYYENDKRYK